MSFPAAAIVVYMMWKHTAQNASGPSEAAWQNSGHELKWEMRACGDPRGTRVEDQSIKNIISEACLVPPEQTSSSLFSYLLPQPTFVPFFLPFPPSTHSYHITFSSDFSPALLLFRLIFHTVLIHNTSHNRLMYFIQLSIVPSLPVSPLLFIFLPFNFTVAFLLPLLQSPPPIHLFLLLATLLTSRSVSTDKTLSGTHTHTHTHTHTRADNSVVLPTASQLPAIPLFPNFVANEWAIRDFFLSQPNKSSRHARMRRATRRRWTTEDKKSYPFLVNPFCFQLHPKQSYYLPWRGWLRYRAESKLPSLRHRLSHRAVSLLLSDTNKVFLSEKKKKRDFSRSTTDKHRCGLALNVSPTCMYGFSLLKMFSHSNICISLRIRQQNELIWNWRNTLISSDFVLFKNVKTVTKT